MRPAGTPHAPAGKPRISTKGAPPAAARPLLLVVLDLLELGVDHVLTLGARLLACGALGAGPAGRLGTLTLLGVDALGHLAGGLGQLLGLGLDVVLVVAL